MQTRKPPSALARGQPEAAGGCQGKPECPHGLHRLVLGRRGGWSPDFMLGGAEAGCDSSLAGATACPELGISRPLPTRPVKPRVGPTPA